MTDDRERLIAQIQQHEGSGPMRNGCYFPYTDTRGRLTLGYGHNLTDAGISQAVADFILGRDIDEAITDCAAFDYFPKLDTIRQRACIDLRFNTGPKGYRTFQRFHMFLGRGDFLRASQELIASEWYHQVQPERSTRLVRMIATGMESV